MGEIEIETIVPGITVKTYFSTSQKGVRYHWYCERCDKKGCREQLKEWAVWEAKKHNREVHQCVDINNM
jgi:hypothetical protein